MKKKIKFPYLSLTVSQFPELNSWEIKIQVVKTEQVTEINFPMNSRKAISLFSMAIISEMAEERRGFAKTHTLLKYDTVAPVDNKSCI